MFIALSILLVCALVAAIYLFVRNQSLVRENSRLLEQSQYFTNSEERLKDVFKSLAASTLESSTKHFLELAKHGLQGQSELQKADLEQRQHAIDEMLKPVAHALEKYQEQIQSIERDRHRTFAAIDMELKKVADLSSTLSKETSGLKDALKRPHVRGRWGELQLKNCIELAGMSEFADVSFQDAFSDSEGAIHIPDMIVRMPGGRQVVVDSKTPIDAFLKSLDAATEEERVAEMVRHGRHVKEHVRALSSRSYQSVLKDTPDFTVMFLPNESFLYAALEQEPDLVEYALQRKVLIATPPTLIGLLKVIRYGWNEERLAENAQAIYEIGKELHKRLCEFVEGYDKVGKFLEKAKEEHDKGRFRLNSRVIVQAQRFESLGVRSGKKLVSEAQNPALETSEPVPAVEELEQNSPSV